MSFNTMKGNRSSAISKLAEAAEKMGGEKTYGNNENEWKPTLDKAGGGYAVIRFLPANEGEDMPWVKYWDHGFKGTATGRWYIENSLTSLNLPDPCSEANSILWNSGREEDKQTARDRKRRLHFISNILVISDAGNPSNEGKVFTFKYGKKIFDKINDVMNPTFEDEKAINPFDFWDGANFKLKITQVEGFRNYEKSGFDSPSQLFGGDDTRLEEIYSQLHPLASLIEYKSYAELKAKFDAVVGNPSSSSFQTGNSSSSASRSTLDEHQAVSTQRSAAEPEYESAPFESLSSDSDPDDSISYFAKLAAED